MHHVEWCNVEIIVESQANSPVYFLWKLNVAQNEEWCWRKLYPSLYLEGKAKEIVIFIATTHQEHTIDPMWEPDEK
jgi:hypothetical protein